MIAYSKADSLTGVMYTHNYTRNQNAMPENICVIIKVQRKDYSYKRQRRLGNGIETEKLKQMNSLF